jgi:hypothetical protein
MDPSYPNDYRHIPVEDAIAHQAGAVIAEMRKLHPELAGESDVALLRFCISFRDNAEAAGAAAAKAATYRKENAAWLGPARQLVEEGKPLAEVYRLAAPHWKVLEPRLAAGVHRTTRFGGPVSYIRAGLIDLDELMDAVEVEELARFFIFDKEVVYTLCDLATRKNGFLTKAMYVMDGANLGIMDANRKFFKAMGESSKISEFLHPQLVQRQCVINASSSFKAVLKMASVFLSKKTLERFVMCSGFDLDKSAADCPYASRWISDMSALPTFCGGTCSCEGGCVGGVPNDFRRHKIELKKDK